VVPVQVPGEAVSISRSCSVPVIVGREVFAGGTAPTTPVEFEVAVLEPATFVPVTWKRIVLFASLGVIAWVWPVSFAMSVQFAPLESQLRHWYVNVIGAVPDQVP